MRERVVPDASREMYLPDGYMRSVQHRKGAKYPVVLGLPGLLATHNLGDGRVSDYLRAACEKGLVGMGCTTAAVTASEGAPTIITGSFDLDRYVSDAARALGLAHSVAGDGRTVGIIACDISAAVLAYGIAGKQGRFASRIACIALISPFPAFRALRKDLRERIGNHPFEDGPEDNLIVDLTTEREREDGIVRQAHYVRLRELREVDAPGALEGKNVDIPTMTCYSENDGLVDAAAIRELHRAFGGKEETLYPYRGGGHYLRPDQVLPGVLGFFQKHLRGLCAETRE